MMNVQILTFATGAAIGALAMSLVSRHGNEPAADHGTGIAQTQSIHPDRHEQKIAALEKRIAELESDRPEEGNRDVEDGTDGAKPGASLKIFGADSHSKIDLAEMQKHMEKAESERAADLASLSAALGLTDGQAERVRALLEKRAVQHASQLGGIFRLATSTLAGDGAAPEVSAVVAEAKGDAGEAPDGFDFDAEILALLGEEQQDAYRDYLQSQHENHIEARANRQLAQLQTTIPDLSKEQKDQAFDEFARIAREDIEAGGSPQQGLPSGGEIGRMIAQREAEKQAMQPILSPEQFEVYESNSSRTFTFGAPAGATIITSEVIVDPDSDRTEIPPIEGE